MTQRPALLLLTLGLLACDSPTPSDAGEAPTDSAPPTCSAPIELERGDADGHPDPLGASAEEARAGRIEASELPRDPSGLLRWREGDFVLANDRVALVIEDVGVSDEFNPHGGQPIGLAVVEGGALSAPADFNEMVLTVGRAVINPDRVTVLADGTGGGAAIIRAEGPLTPLGFLAFLGGFLSAEIDGIDIAMDYVLEPGSESVEVRFVVANQGPDRIALRQPYLWAFQQNRMPKFGPGEGFDVQVGSRFPYLSFVEEGATSFAFESYTDDLMVFLEESNLLAIQLPAFAAAGCELTEHLVGRYHIGAPGLDGALLARAATETITLQPIRGTVQTSDGAPAGATRVYALDGDGVLLSRTRTAEDGSFTLHVEDPSVTLRAFRRGDPPSADTPVSAPADSVTLRLGDAGELTVNIADPDGAPIPALVQAVPVGRDAIETPAAHGEPRVLRGRSDVRYSVDGRAVMRLPAGDYEVHVSRGYEWERETVAATITDAAATELDVTLQHVIDTPSVMCGDFHLHTNRSFDAIDDAELKVRAAAAQGLEIPVRSDHEWVGSFESLITELGLEDELYSIASLELTTFEYGHFGVFPLDPEPEARNQGSIDWVGLNAPELLSMAEARTGAFGPARVIINHPRASLSLLGYFNAIGFDPVTATSANLEQTYDDFQLVEVFNASDFDANEDSVVRDWFALLSSGRRVFAVGSSDSHAVWRTTIGYPRTCIDLGVDTTGELRALGAGLVRDRLTAGAATISGGVFVEATGPGGEGLGETVSSAPAQVPFAVRVRAPSWVTVDRLRVYADGSLSQTIAIDATTEDPLDATVRFDDTIDVEADHYVVFVADGAGDLAPVHPGLRPFGVTNPVFIER